MCIRTLARAAGVQVERNGSAAFDVLEPCRILEKRIGVKLDERELDALRRRFPAGIDGDACVARPAIELELRQRGVELAAVQRGLNRHGAELDLIVDQLLGGKAELAVHGPER